MADSKARLQEDSAQGQPAPFFVVFPRVAFGLFEKGFLSTATRWQFEKAI